MTVRLATPPRASTMFVEASSQSMQWVDDALYPDSDIDFTLEFWLLNRTAVNAFEPFASKGSDDPTTGWYAFWEASGFTTPTLQFDDARSAPNGIPSVSQNVWFYIAWVHSAAANTVQGYYATAGGPLLTGTLTSSIAGPTGNTENLRLGGQVFGSFCNNNFAMARYWNRALTRGELADRYRRRYLPGDVPKDCTFYYDPGQDFYKNLALNGGRASTGTFGTIDHFRAPSREHFDFRTRALPEIWQQVGGVDYKRRYSLTLTGVG